MFPSQKSEHARINSIALHADGYMRFDSDKTHLLKLNMEACGGGGGGNTRKFAFVRE